MEYKLVIRLNLEKLVYSITFNEYVVKPYWYPDPGRKIIGIKVIADKEDKCLLHPIYLLGKFDIWYAEQDLFSTKKAAKEECEKRNKALQ